MLIDEYGFGNIVKQTAKERKRKQIERKGLMREMQLKHIRLTTQFIQSDWNGEALMRKINVAAPISSRLSDG